MRTTRVESWTHLQECLFEGSYNVVLDRYRAPFVYRGLTDASFDLRTSLIQLGGDFAKLERHLLRNFRKYAHREGRDKADPPARLDLLALRRHALRHSAP